MHNEHYLNKSLTGCWINILIHREYVLLIYQSQEDRMHFDKQSTSIWIAVYFKACTGSESGQK